MNKEEPSPELIALCEQVTGRRPRIVIKHILEHGYVTTYELQSIYGYAHAPRAARDVRESGVPLETFKVISEGTGRKIGAYRFGDPASIKRGRIGGRKAFPKRFKEDLVARYNSKDAFTGETLNPRYLQIDHRVPYEVAGEKSHDELNVEEFMLIDSSGQRAKSWSCEQCQNWQETKDAAICRMCFWAFPENHEHVAGEQVRRVDIEWRGGVEVRAFDKLRQRAEREDMTVAALLKKISKT